jgi:ABC-type glutathione transport system ATPase component
MARGRTTAIAGDNLDYLVYTNNKITRFTDFHLTYSREGFFFNIVLQNICFRDEKELLSNQNKEQSYVYECHIWGLLPNSDILQEYLLKYAHRNLIETEKRTQLLENLFEEYPYLDPEYIVPDIGPSTDMNVQCQQAKEIRYKHVSHIFDIQISEMKLTQEQEDVLDSIMAHPKGLHVLIGTPGSGKSYFIKYIIQYLQLKGKTVLLSGTTGAATRRLSKTANMVHTTF